MGVALDHAIHYAKKLTLPKVLKYTVLNYTDRPALDTEAVRSKWVLISSR